MQMKLLTLSGHALISGESFKPAADRLISMGCGSVLIKGGHFQLVDRQSLDYWCDGMREVVLTSPRLENVQTHGYRLYVSECNGCCYCAGLCY